LKYKNFTLLQEIVSALDSTCVSRLKSTWDKIRSVDKQKFESFKEILDNKSNYTNYRKRLDQSSCPSIPILGVLFGDLNAIEETISTKEDGLYNIKKLRKVYDLISTFKDRITGTYNFSREDFEFLDWYSNGRHIESDFDTRYALSCECEASKRVNTQKHLISTDTILSENTNQEDLIISEITFSESQLEPNPDPYGYFTSLPEIPSMKDMSLT